MHAQPHIIFTHAYVQRQAPNLCLILQMMADINAKLKEGTWRPVAGKEVVVELVPAGDYWLAEDYHQQYLQKGGQDASKGASSGIRCYG